MSKASQTVAKRVLEVHEAREPKGQYLHNKDTGAVGIPSKSKSMKKTVGEMVASGELLLNEDEGNVIWVFPGSISDVGEEEPEPKPAEVKGKKNRAKEKAEKAAREPKKPTETFRFSKQRVKDLQKVRNDAAKGEDAHNICLCGCGTRVNKGFAMGHDARLAGFFSRFIKGKGIVEEFERAYAVIDHEVVMASKKLGPLAKQAAQLREDGQKCWDEA